MFNKSQIALACGSALLLSGGSFAQSKNTESQAKQEQEIETIVVKGSRAQMRSAINSKRVRQQISDSIGEDEVGNLPDFNAAEALSRIPGVSIANDQAEGRFVTIRGMNSNYNQTTIDGAEVSSTDIDGSRIEMDVIPASLAGKIEVIKSLTPDMDANAIGGTINFVSRSAYDYDKGFFAISGSIGKYDQDNGYNGQQPSGNSDLVYSTTFGSNEQFGVVATANYYKRASYLGRIEQGDEILFIDQAVLAAEGQARPRYDRVAPYQSKYFVPEEWKALNYHNNRQRYGGAFKIEHRPSSNTRTWLRAYFNKADDSESRMETKMWNRQKTAVVTFDTPSRGELIDTEWTTQIGRFEFERETYGAKLAGRYQISDSVKLEPSINLSGASYQQPQQWQRFKQAKADFSFDTSGRITRWASTSEDAFNASLFDYEKLELNYDRMDEEKLSFKADLFWQDDSSWSAKVGIKLQSKDKSYQYNRDEYKFGDGLTLADINWSRGCPSQMPSCANDLFITMNLDSLDALTEAYKSSEDTSFNDKASESFKRAYDATEEVNSLYAMLTHIGDKHALTFGVRYENTHFESQGFREDKDLKEWVETTNENDYSNALLSANYTYDLTDNLLFRAAFSQSISRPRISYQVARGELIDFDGTELSITRGNPELRPREADNFDLGAEWYFAENTGLLSATLFHKVIDNQIFRTTRDDEVLYDQDGDGSLELTPASIRQYVNGDEVKVKGLELGYTQELDHMLPGLGFNLNATMLDSDWKFELESGEVREPETFLEQPDFTANAIVYYQLEEFEVRLAANHTGLKLNKLYTSKLADAYRDQYSDGVTRFDLQLKYSFSEHLSSYLNVWNLTDKKSYEMMGANQQYTRFESSPGRAVFIGFSYVN